MTYKNDINSGMWLKHNKDSILDKRRARNNVCYVQQYYYQRPIATEAMRVQCGVFINLMWFSGKSIFLLKTTKVWWLKTKKKGTQVNKLISYKPDSKEPVLIKCTCFICLLYKIRTWIAQRKHLIMGYLFITNICCF